MPCPWRGMMRFKHPGDAPDNVPDSQKSPGMFPATFPIGFPIWFRDSPVHVPVPGQRLTEMPRDRWRDAKEAHQPTAQARYLCP